MDKDAAAENFGLRVGDGDRALNNDKVLENDSGGVDLGKARRGCFCKARLETRSQAVEFLNESCQTMRILT